MAAVVKPLFIGKIAKSNKEKENEAVKKWVVEIEKESGRVETRLVPARNKCTAITKETQYYHVFRIPGRT